MGDEFNDDVNRRRRPIPVPLYDDRYIERPYLKKVELARIRNNLDKLVDIEKGGAIDKNVDRIVDKPKIDMPEPKKDDTKVVSDIPNIPNITNVSPPVTNTNVNPEIIKVETKFETKKEDIKVGINNFIDNKVVDNRNKQTNIVENKNKPKIIKRKVIRMSDEDVGQGYNISPEDRRRLRKSEIKEFQDEEETAKAVRRSADLAEQNARDLKEFKLNLAKENEEIKKELKSEISNKFGQVDQKFSDMSGKFNEVGGRFDRLSGKLEETCTGIDCLKKDIAKMNKNTDLIECPECGEKVVPPLASFCPSCSAKMYSWTDDDGKPVKGWKPTWEK